MSQCIYKIPRTVLNTEQILASSLVFHNYVVRSREEQSVNALTTWEDSQREHFLEEVNQMRRRGAPHFSLGQPVVSCLCVFIANAVLWGWGAGEDCVIAFRKRQEIQNIICEVSQSEKDKYSMISLICGI